MEVQNNLISGFIGSKRANNGSQQCTVTILRMIQAARKSCLNSIVRVPKEEVEKRGLELHSNPNHLVAKSLYYLLDQDRLGDVDTVHSLFHYVTDSVVLET